MWVSECRVRHFRADLRTGKLGTVPRERVCIGLVFKTYKETRVSEGDTSLFLMKNIKYELIFLVLLRILIRKLFFFINFFFIIKLQQ